VSVGKSFWASLPLGPGVELLAHDANGLAAFAKPAGVLSHPNSAKDEPRSLLNARYALDGEVYSWRDAANSTEPKIWLLNRLDSATSGVILVAASEELAREIRAQFKRKQVKKVYAALVFGTPRQASELWRDLLAVEKRGGQVRTDSAAGNIPAECRMSVVRAGRREPRLSLLRLEPRTGRSHQLRVQSAKRHLPVVGDQTYGDFPRNREFAKLFGEKRLFLHSLESVFAYEFHGKTFSFAARAPLPPEFEKFL
jgi:tRNA pseudouridine65 synthase